MKSRRNSRQRQNDRDISGCFVVVRSVSRCQLRDTDCDETYARLLAQASQWTFGVDKFGGVLQLHQTQKGGLKLWQRLLAGGVASLVAFTAAATSDSAVPDVGAIPDPWLERVRDRFQVFLKSVPENERVIQPEYAGFLQPHEDVAVNEVVEDSQRLDAERVYTVSAAGTIVEVNPESYVPPSTTAEFQTTSGAWTVSVEESLESFELEESVADEASAAIDVTLPASALEAFLHPWQSLLPVQHAAFGGARLEVAPEQLSADDQDLVPAPVGDELVDSAVNKPERMKRTSIFGHLTVPDGIDPASVFIRVAGTAVEVGAGADGTFAISDLAVGSKMELLVWDTYGALTRRLVPVFVAEHSPALSVVLQRTDVIDSIAQAFGMPQDLLKAGFCGDIVTDVPALRMGARVEVVGDQLTYPVGFFGEYGLPDPEVTEVTADGRFCVFNVEETRLRVRIVLANGFVREAVQTLLPTVFEPVVVFDLRTSVFRKPLPVELVDRAAAEQFQTALDFNVLGNHSWANEAQPSVWAPVTNLWLRSAAAYAPSFLAGPSVEPLYFAPAGEFVEVSWGNDEAEQNVFSLWGSQALMTEHMRSKLAADGAVRGSLADWREPFVLPMTSATAVSAALDSKGLPGVEETGGALVVIDRDYFGVDSSELRVAVRHLWTGLRVGQLAYLDRVRGVSETFAVVGDLPTGDYSLVVSDSRGALLWTDIVRIIPGKAQLIVVGGVTPWTPFQSAEQKPIR